MHLSGAPGVIHTTDHIDKKVHLNHDHPVVLTERVIPADIYEPINPLTADTTAYTADNTTWPTADTTYIGALDIAEVARAAIAAAIIEAADAAEIADAISVIAAIAIEAANATEYADANSILLAEAIEVAGALDDIDAALLGSIISADLSEPIGGRVTADSTAYTADATWPTADGGILPGAIDSSDATVIAAEIEIPVSGGARYPRLRPLPVYGVGFGILPELRGDAHGVVIIAGIGAGTLPRLVGAAAGTIGAAGRGASQLTQVRAAAIGDRGQAGAAVAVLKGLSVASTGAIATHGSGSGTIMKFEATASGRHDDDEAAVMAFLLAA